MSGGLEALVCQLAETLAREGDFSPIVYAAYTGGPLGPMLAERGCAYRILRDFETLKARLRDVTGLAGTKNDWYASAQKGLVPRSALATSCFGAVADLAVLPRLVAAIQHDDVRVVHAHGLSVAFLAGVAGKVTGRPVILTSHNEGHVVGRFPDRVRRRMAGWAIDAGTGVSIRASACLARELAWRLDRVSVIQNGIVGRGLSTIPPADSAARVVGIAGNLHSLKGHRILLDAFRRMRASERKAQLLILGDGPERSSLEQLAESLGVRGAVSFLGAYNGPSDPTYVRFLTGANVIAVPSFAEASPLVVLEAMAAGRPVVATRVGGIPDMIEEYVTGLFVDRGDAAALAAVLSELTCDPPRCARMGAAGRERYSQLFTASEMAARYRAIYKSLVQGPETTGPTLRWM
jgi:glycosyltransferase involved in cell wall biosynthesis